MNEDGPRYIDGLECVIHADKSRCCKLFITSGIYSTRIDAEKNDEYQKVRFFKRGSIVSCGVVNYLDAKQIDEYQKVRFFKRGSIVACGVVNYLDAKQIDEKLMRKRMYSVSLKIDP
jgi:hypothetical protein